MSQDFIQNWGHFPEIKVIQEPFWKVNLVLSAQDHWFCTLAKLGSVFSNWISARPRQGGDQVDHARDVHSPQNPWLSLNRAPQITIFYIHMSRITSRLPRVRLIEKIQQVYWFRGSLLKCKFY